MVESDIDESQVANIELEAGQVSLHHGHVFHASGPNQTDARRIGVAIRYIRPSAKQTLVENDCAVLVRGEDRFGHFNLLAPPSQDIDDATIARFGLARTLREKVYFEGAN